MEERRRSYEDRPRSLLIENLLSTAFAAHPYKWPTIGWMQDLENMSWRDARAWYRQWYAPNNAIVVVVGDVEPQAGRTGAAGTEARYGESAGGTPLRALGL
jgi:zinc protease